MPAYDYRCNSCGREVSLFYKSYKDYDAATPTCPHCGSSDLERVINGVTLQTGGRNYSGMSSQEMLSVLESDDIKMELSTPSRAGILLPADTNEGEDILMLVMPVMLGS